MFFFDRGLNKRLSKQSWGGWLQTPSGSLWRHCNVAASNGSQFTTPMGYLLGSAYNYVNSAGLQCRYTNIIKLKHLDNIIADIRNARFRNDTALDNLWRECVAYTKKVQSVPEISPQGRQKIEHYFPLFLPFSPCFYFFCKLFCRILNTILRVLLIRLGNAGSLLVRQPSPYFNIVQKLQGHGWKFRSILP